MPPLLVPVLTDAAVRTARIARDIGMGVTRITCDRRPSFVTTS
jgi:hypothetical protein